MDLSPQFRSAVCAAMVVIFIIPLVALATAAAGPGSPSTVAAISGNDTVFSGVTPDVTDVPRRALEQQDPITLFRLDGPDEEYPGARPIVSGPRSIQLTTDFPTLIILAAAAGMVALAFALCRKRKAAGADDREPAG